MTIQVIAPSFAAGVVFTAQSGTSYTSNVNGIINVTNPADLPSLASAGCAVMPERPVVTLGSSGAIVLGAINIIPSTAGSSVTYLYTLGAPTILGVQTTIIQPAASTAVSTVTSTGCNIGTGTVITFSSAGQISLVAVGSTLHQIASRGVVASSLVTLNPASS